MSLVRNRKVINCLELRLKSIMYLVIALEYIIILEIEVKKLLTSQMTQSQINMSKNNQIQLVYYIYQPKYITCLFYFFIILKEYNLFLRA